MYPLVFNLHYCCFLHSIQPILLHPNKNIHWSNFKVQLRHSSATTGWPHVRLYVDTALFLLISNIFTGFAGLSLTQCTWGEAFLSQPYEAHCLSNTIIIRESYKSPKVTIFVDFVGYDGNQHTDYHLLFWEIQFLSLLLESGWCEVTQYTACVCHNNQNKNC